MMTRPLQAGKQSSTGRGKKENTLDGTHPSYPLFTQTEPYNALKACMRYHGGSFLDVCLWQSNHTFHLYIDTKTMRPPLWHHVVRPRCLSLMHAAGPGMLRKGKTT
eukprot:1141598-Pelagomonas_calceolata.AAC.4